MSVIRTWLPPPEVEAAVTEDPERFRSIFKGLREQWENDASLKGSYRCLKTLEWLSLVRSLEIERNKAAVGSEDVNAAFLLMLEIVLRSEDCLAARTRWAEILTSFVHSFRWKITVTVPWEPFHAILTEYLHRPCSNGYQGPLCKGQEIERVVNLARRCRRYFPAGSAAQIWEMLRPKIANTHQPEAFEALGMLVALMPTRQVKDLAGDWNSWASEWLAAWDGIVHSNAWDGLWMTFMSRLAKHDSSGAIDWALLLPRLFSKCLWAFQVPVGTASAAPPFGRRPPESLNNVFQPLLTKRSPRVAKLLIWLLGRVPCQGESDSMEEQDAVLLALERMCSLLEQYYHPSNNGKWTSTLALFLERLTRHLAKRAFLEQSPGANPEQGSSDDEDTPPVQPNGSARPAASARAPLSEAMQRRVALAIVQLATKAQYAKDRDMVSKACFALAKMVAWVPDVVLPVVHERFEIALEAVTAAHQLSIAVHTLGLVARPLLLAGLALRNGEAYDAASLPPREAAATAVANAMMAVLPGIDANDDRKTRAVFRFYCVVLSSTAVPPAAAGISALPLQTEEWLEELLARLFTLLSNLDSPETRSDLPAGGQQRANHDCQSFLLTDDCMFRPMLELLLSRLPEELQRLAVRRVARFVTGTTLPSVAVESGNMCAAVVLAAPDVGRTLIIEPLLSRVEGELPALKRAAANPGGMQISKVQEASLRWQLTLLMPSVAALGPEVLKIKPRLLSVLDALLAFPSLRVAEPSANFLESLLHALTFYYPVEDSNSKGGPWIPGTGTDGADVEAWISLGGRGVPPEISQGLKPTWHVPSPQEVEFAEELLQRHLVAAAKELKAASSGGGSMAAKERVRVLLSRVHSCLRGVQSCLPDFEPAHDLPGAPLVMRAKSGATVGSPAMRAEVARCLQDCGDFSDPEVMQHLIEVVDEVLSIGFEEHADYSNNMITWKTDSALLHESPIAYRTHKQPGKWRHLRPQHMHSQRAHFLVKARAAEAVFRPQATAAFPKPPLTWVPPIFKDLSTRLLGYSMQSYRGVANSAEGALRRALKRYPCLIPAVLPTLLDALAGHRAGEGPDPRAAMDDPPPQEAWDHHVPLAVLSQLAVTARNANTTATATASSELSVADLARDEGRVLGAIGVLSSPALWRACTRHMQPSMAVMAAVLASGVHHSPTALQSCTHYFTLFFLRYLRPAGMESPTWDEDEHVKIAMRMLLDIGSATPAVPVHWRFSLLANSLVLVLLPPATEASAAQLSAHFFPHLSDPLPAQRSLAAAFFIFMLTGNQAWKNDKLLEAVKGVIWQQLEPSKGDKGWGETWLERLSHDHPFAPADSNEGGQHKGSGRSKEDMLARVVGATLEKHLEWPRGRPLPSAATDGSFNLIHVVLTAALASAAPEQVIRSVKQPLAATLTGPPAREDRPMTLAAIEVLTGLLASGTLFLRSSGGGSEWDSWARGLLLGALNDAPQDYSEVWAVAMRYATHRLAGADPSALAALLDLASQQPPAAGGSGAMVRWLKIQGNLLCELNALGVIGCQPFPESSPVHAVGQAFQIRTLQALRDMAAATAPDLRRHAASCIVVLVASLLPSGEPPAEGTSSTELANGVGELLDDLVLAMEEGAAAVAAAEGHGPDGLQEEASLLQSPVIARLGTGLQVVNQSLRGGEGLCVIAMRPTLLRMLPSLLKIQEMAAPELQPLALEAKSAAASLKYLPVTSSQIGTVVAAIEAVSTHELWPARAAALVFGQYFWFRHMFQMTGEHSQRCQRLVLRLMRDRKLEVQESAASTLSGMLKALSEADFNALRTDLLRQTQALFPRDRKSRQGAADVAMTEKHAVVLGLKAFVLCTPYDVPLWLPEILLALVQASTQPAPIKTTVRKTLGEFKRTHEHTGLLEVKRALSSDQWEAIQGIASPASYFA